MNKQAHLISLFLRSIQEISKMISIMVLEDTITLMVHIMKVTGNMVKSKVKDYFITPNLNLDNQRNLKGCLKMMKWLDLIGKRKLKRMQLCYQSIF